MREKRKTRAETLAALVGGKRKRLKGEFDVRRGKKSCPLLKMSQPFKNQKSTEEEEDESVAQGEVTP